MSKLAGRHLQSRCFDEVELDSGARLMAMLGRDAASPASESGICFPKDTATVVAAGEAGASPAGLGDFDDALDAGEAPCPHLRPGR